MMVLVRWIKHPLDVTVQGSHDADPRKHRRPAFRCEQDQRFHRRLPFRRLVLGFRQPGDVGPGILERDELAAVRQDDRILECSLPAARSGTRLPIMRHVLAAIEAPVFFRGPIALTAPCLKIGLGAVREEYAPSILEIGARLIERSRGAARMFSWMRSRIDPQRQPH
jgi:hypothetical protein